MIINARFEKGSHTVTQSSAKGGCSALTSGFASPTQSSGTFSWIVTGTGPWYYYCAVNGHCAAGMVGSLTLASTSANGTASTKSAASGSMTTGSVTGSASDTASSSGTSSSSSSTPTSSKVSAAVGQIQTSWVVFALVVVALTAMLV
ncbi:hypothetical protein BC938DRAFT_472512 [Jimgerdemannia flammicorona]|uniref:Phytocyanin domain-containing protein n=1 Tax=Jimgerdemannia flammicorona TaxID=994334 RepID=A0A433QTV5_9FUNG|nr:hypothetical protein BC938DRAFT_472512 [Jimgerdemannia flammicorona]